MLIDALVISKKKFFGGYVLINRTKMLQVYQYMGNQEVIFLQIISMTLTLFLQILVLLIMFLGNSTKRLESLLCFWVTQRSLREFIMNSMFGRSVCFFLFSPSRFNFFQKYPYKQIVFAFKRFQLVFGSIFLEGNEQRNYIYEKKVRYSRTMLYVFFPVLCGFFFSFPSFLLFLDMTLTRDFSLLNYFLQRREKVIIFENRSN
eukprot:TRINITY_DN951_c0_g1_i9.p5 TRINITY_DN951_c0_g1~~TRINITY_DN951_c0_g1_i9.p5  ORF type:complete len:203 (+),score=-0.56 TRINITY_DN951_c0_g1_i9:859-1467(+)